jgi:DNA mismatch repair protein MutS
VGSGRPGGVIARAARGARAPHDVSAAEKARHGNGSAAPSATPSGAADSPLIAQYLALKAQYPDALLLSRVGDFYEAYGDDAVELASALNIVCTSKEAGKGKRVAMAGVPHHSADHYLARLLRQRRIVAIAEQMEEPVPNRLVRREIVRVLTPGTVLEDQFLDAARNNYLCALACAAGFTAIAAADVSTSSAFVSLVADEDALASELDRLAPAEIVVEAEEEAGRIARFLDQRCRVAVYDPSERPEVESAALAQLSVAEQPAARQALGLLLRYLTHLRLDGKTLVAHARLHETRNTMSLDRATRRHLDLLVGSGESKTASLLAVLDRTKTSMGARLLAQWLCAPLLDVDEIRARHNDVAAFMAAPSFRVELQRALANVGDVERIVQKIHARRAGPRDVAALRHSLESAASAAGLLALESNPRFARFAAAMRGSGEAGTAGAPGGAAAAVAGLIETILLDEPSATLSEGGVIRPESSVELAELLRLRTGGREQLLALEAQTRAETGIKNLKIKYTQAFGYYYEVTRSQSHAMPQQFVRRQSLVNAERFTDERLRELEAKLVSGRTQQVALERRLFEALLEKVDAHHAELLACARAIAEVDVFCSLAQVAAEQRYCRPRMVAESAFAVEAGRHPVVEAFGGLDFVPNDCIVDSRRRFLLITGPNMGGKSTYLRQSALISILAQMGSFVPAASATLGIVDRLFTRIGAGDDIAAGRSTFYVEMAEMALILRNCTPRSLLLIDEVGRGTGTIDGLAIAQAISEYLLNLGDAMPVVLFATHFHELVDLAKTYGAIANLHVAVADEPAGPVFSHRLLPGSSSRSYGIAVATMAGMPRPVVERAQEIASELATRPPLATRRGKAPPHAHDLGNQLEMEIR